MEIFSWQKFKTAHFLVCLFGTIGLTTYSISRYLENGNLTLMQTTKFHSSKEAIYPSFSICILPPFLENKFDIYDTPDINMTSYIQFLQGKLWDERMLEVDYDNVTISLSDNLLDSEFMTHDRKLSTWHPFHYVSFRSSRRKCFTINAPFTDQKPIKGLSLFIKNDIFPSGERESYNLYTYLHFPGQRFTSYYTIRYDWPKRTNNSSKNYAMLFDIKNIDVVTQRNTRHEPCHSNWQNFDQHLMDDIMLDVGCHPPHRNSTYNIPLCTNLTQMKQVDMQPSTSKVDSYDPPCKFILRLDYVYKETDLDYR